VYANVIRILVPLTASDELLAEGLGIISRLFEELA
jgi:4-aminobutyrate aminotransferase-like enzyme